DAPGLTSSAASYRRGFVRRGCPCRREAQKFFLDSDFSAGTESSLSRLAVCACSRTVFKFLGNGLRKCCQKDDAESADCPNTEALRDESGIPILSWLNVPGIYVARAGSPARQGTSRRATARTS